jgi:hypothetical protein
MGRRVPIAHPTMASERRIFQRLRLSMSAFGF